MHRTPHSEKVNWLGELIEEKKIIPAKHQGNYYIVCKKCPHGINLKSKLGRHKQYRRNGDHVILLRANQINAFKRKHDVSLGHNFTILHESVAPVYIQKQMRGEQEYLTITV